MRMTAVRGIELIHDKDPLALRVLREGLFDVGLEISKVGAISLPVATSKLASNRSHAFCIQTPGIRPDPASSAKLAWHALWPVCPFFHLC